MVRQLVQTPWVVLAMVLVLAACGGDPAPEAFSALPAPALDDLAPAVRAQVEAAYAQARDRPRDAAASGQVGMVLQAHGRFAAASVWYERARLLDPDAFRWAYYHGLTLEEQSRPEAALAAYRDALALDPDYAAARLRLAGLLLAAGQLDESRRHYETVLARHPDWADAHLGYGRLLRQQGDLDAAIEAFLEALERGGDFGAAHYALALAYRQQGDSTRADVHFGLFERYEDTQLSITDPLRLRLEELNATDRPHLLRGERLLRQGRLPEAVAEYLKAVERNPQSTNAYAKLVFLYGRLGQIEEAEAYYRKAEALDPNEAEHHFNLAEVYLAMGRYGDAAALYRRVVAVDSLNANAYAQLGDALERQGAMAEALPHYQAALRVDPFHRQANFAVGRALAAREQYDEALAHLQKSLEPEDGKTAAILYLMAAVYIKKGDEEQAVAALQRARSIAARTRNSALLARIEADLRRAGQAPSPQP